MSLKTYRLKQEQVKIFSHLEKVRLGKEDVKKYNTDFQFFRESLSNLAIHGNSEDEKEWAKRILNQFDKQLAIIGLYNQNSISDSEPKQMRITQDQYSSLKRQISADYLKDFSFFSLSVGFSFLLAHLTGCEPSLFPFEKVSIVLISIGIISLVYFFLFRSRNNNILDEIDKHFKSRG